MIDKSDFQDFWIFWEYRLPTFGLGGRYLLSFCEAACVWPELSIHSLLDVIGDFCLTPQGGITLGIVLVRMRVCVCIFGMVNCPQNNTENTKYAREIEQVLIFLHMPCISCHMCTVHIRNIGWIKNARHTMPSVFRPLRPIHTGDELAFLPNWANE